MAEEVYLYCPKCNQKQLLTANLVNVQRAQASVLKVFDHCEIDWDSMEIDGDFEYCCDFCGTRLAKDMEDVERQLKEIEGEKNG